MSDGVLAVFSLAANVYSRVCETIPDVRVSVDRLAKGKKLSEADVWILCFVWTGSTRPKGTKSFVCEINFKDALQAKHLAEQLSASILKEDGVKNYNYL